MFCSWGAEEYGLVGSIEWVEVGDNARQKIIKLVFTKKKSMNCKFPVRLRCHRGCCLLCAKLKLNVTHNT